MRTAAAVIDLAPQFNAKSHRDASSAFVSKNSGVDLIMRATSSSIHAERI